ncbi:hypothetical protein [Bacillus phage vB_BanS-Thrax4]|nr:hypothetical protein [Bacillus phage vB_BanS-Thrax4]
MRERITDELIEHFARGYHIYKSAMKQANSTPSTFEQYVEFCLVQRKELTRKALNHIEAKKA